MDIRPIRTEADYRTALREISALIDADPAPRTAQGDRLDILATLVQAYEAKRFPIDLPDPVEAIKFRMEQSGLSVKDLEPIIGRSNRVYEILNRKRPLTLAMVRRLPPAEVIVDLGGACNGRPEGALVVMGYPHPFRTLTIVEPPRSERHEIYRDVCDDPPAPVRVPAPRAPP